MGLSMGMALSSVMVMVMVPVMTRNCCQQERSGSLAMFTTSASWINQVGRWFAQLTRKWLRRGVHTSVRQLQADILTFIDRHNQNPRPFKWTKSADQILAPVRRFCHKAQQTLCGKL